MLRIRLPRPVDESPIAVFAPTEEPEKRRIPRRPTEVGQWHYMTKADAARWLAGMLGIPEDECEVARFDVRTCQQAVTACLELARKVN